VNARCAAALGLLFGTGSGQGCSLDLAATDQALVVCQVDADCPRGLVCIVGPNRCQAPGQACSEQREGRYVAVADGNACANDQLDGRTICVGGACARSACGDAYVDAELGEQCDAGAANSDILPDACRTSCVAAHCGDGVRDSGEACDDGNDVSEDGCLPGCVLNVCGDGTRDPAREECDDGNAINDDACLDTCVANVCGDGFVDATHEQCDDGANTNPNDGCLACQRVAWSTVVRTGGARKASADVSLDSVDSLAIRPDGQLVVLSSVDKRLYAYDPVSDTVTVLAGTGLSCSNVEVDCADGESATNTRFINPVAVALGVDGAVYVGDNGATMIRRIDPATGLIARIAGSGLACADARCGDGKSALRAPLLGGGASALALDATGSLFVLESSANRVRKITADTYVIFRAAGSGSACSDATKPCGDGASAILASMNGPTGVALDALGNLYIADANDARIRKVTQGSSPVISTVAGNGVACVTTAAPDCGDDVVGGALGATLSTSLGALAVFGTTLYFADGQRLRALDLTSGTLSALAGTGAWCDTAADPSCGDGGAPLAATFYTIASLAVGHDGTLYIADSGVARVRALDPARTLIRAVLGYQSTYANPSGHAALSALVSPSAMAIDVSGEVLVSDSARHQLLRVQLGTGLLSVVAGTGAGCVTLPCGDGQSALGATLNAPLAIAVSGSGDIYLADHIVNPLDWSVQGLVRKITRTSGLISTVVAPFATPTSDGPAGLALEASGVLYVSDTGNHVVLRRATNGVVTDYAGDRTACVDSTLGCNDGAALAAQLRSPKGLALGADGSLFIADYGDERVRRVDPSGTTIDTVAGDGHDCADDTCGDGGLPTAAQLPSPASLALRGGVLYVGNSGSWYDRLRRVVVGASIGTLSATNSGTSWADGVPLGSSTVTYTNALSFDSAGQLFVLDSYSVRRVLAATPASPLPTDLVTSIAATASINLAAPGDGLLDVALLSDPRAVVGLGDGNTFLVAEAVTWPSAGYSGMVGRIRLAEGQLDTVIGYTKNYSPAFASGMAARYTPAFGETAGLALEAGSPMQLYVSDAYDNLILRVRLVDANDPASWRIERLAGTPLYYGANVDGPCDVSQFYGPMGLALDASTRTLYVAERDNHDLRAIDLNAVPCVVTTIAGQAGNPAFLGDGGPAIASALFAPEGLSVVPGVSLYVADTGNHRVRRIDLTSPEHTITTVIGGGTNDAPRGAPAQDFRIDSPRGLLVDAAGDLFLTSRVSVRVVAAGTDGIATFGDSTALVYGASRAAFPESATSCLTGMSWATPDTSILLLDRCVGYLVELRRIAP